MKKIIKYFLIAITFFITGCTNKTENNILNKIEKKLNDANSYYLEGKMQIINHEDTYNYNIKVSYQKPDYYKIELINTQNNHEQVILRNDEGVYVPACHRPLINVIEHDEIGVILFVIRGRVLRFDNEIGDLADPRDLVTKRRI